MKRKRRDMNPSNQHNWALVCSACGAEFSMAETISLDGTAEGGTHWTVEHPDLENAHFNLVWVGIGPPPKKGRGHARRS